MDGDVDGVIELTDSISLTIHKVVRASYPLALIAFRYPRPSPKVTFNFPALLRAE